MSSAMEIRVLGRTGIEVPVLGLGGAGSLMNQHLVITDLGAVRLVRLARRLGIRYVDTAPIYGMGMSEARIGRALAGDTGAVVATKTGLAVEGGALVPDLSADAVRRAVHESLARLRRDVIDVVQVHEVTVSSLPQVLAKRGALEALRALQAEGVVRHIGVTGSDAAALVQAVETGEFDVVQVWRRWNLLDRSGEAVLDAAQRHGVGVVVGAPFASGILARPTGRTSELHYGAADAEARAHGRALDSWVRGLGASLAAVAFHAALDPRVSTVVVGVRDAAQLRANVAIAADTEVGRMVRSPGFLDELPRT